MTAEEFAAASLVLMLVLSTVVHDQDLLSCNGGLPEDSLPSSMFRSGSTAESSWSNELEGAGWTKKLANCQSKAWEMSAPART